MNLLRRVDFLCIAALQAAVAWAQAPPAAEIRGRVTTPREEPIPGVEVGIVNGTQSAISDSAGRFVLRGVPAGLQVIRVRRIGFVGQYLSADLAEGERKDVVVVMRPGSYQLPDVEVTARAAKPIEYAWTTKYDDFFRRKRVGLGHYVTREEIEQRNPWRTPNILAGIPGVRLRFRHPGSSGTDVAFSGCGRVSVWIDGWKQRYPDLPPYPGAGLRRPSIGQQLEGTPMAVGTLLDRVLPIQIEMVEVYTSPAEMPAEFLDDSCGAIAIWTR